ncbi:MAG: rhamnogalacturonan acetylesterase [Aristaeellaceae bacterium]
MATIWIIGDSTVEDNKPPFRGWGWAIPRHAAEGVTVRNHGLSGRSTRSFRDEGLFVPVQEGMQAGDLLLIQFGHNDEKEDAERHTDPDSTYPEFLAWYCDEALQRGTQPVLITPVSRRWWLSDTDMLYTHGEYPAAVRKLAAERNIPLVDLKAASRALYLSLGQEKTAELFVRIAKGENPDFPEGHDDKTHFNAYGAERIAELVVDGLRQDERTRRYVK